MIKHFFLSLLFLATTTIFAQNNETLFKQAEEFYNQGNYHCKPKVNQPICILI